MTRPALITLDQAVQRVKAASRIVITTHARADGDAIGCVTALQRVLRQAGKSADAFLHEPPTDTYAFLSALEPIAIWPKAADLPPLNKGRAGVGSLDSIEKTLANADLLILADTCAAVQINELVEPWRAAAAKKLAIDHHISRDDVADEAWVDEKAGACALLLVRLFDAAGWPIDETAATLLYTGLATDTGWFRFSNAGESEFTTAARLVKSGAKPNALYERLYNNESLARVRLMGAAMSSFSLLADGRLAVIRLTREVFARCEATSSMTEDIINEPMRLGSVVATVMFSEPTDGGPIRVSLRSKSRIADSTGRARPGERDVDVAAIAGKFGGGGHARAAGAKVEGKIESVEESVVSEMLSALR